MSLEILPNVYFTPIPRDTALFDVDGFISDQSKRTHYIEKSNKSDKDWLDFFSEQNKDLPIKPNIQIMKSYQELGHTIILLTSRPQNYDNDLIRWLESWGIHAHMIISRPNKNTPEGKRFRTSAQFKTEVIKSLKATGWNIKAFYDDHKQNVKEVYEVTGVPSFYIVTMGSPGYSE